MRGGFEVSATVGREYRANQTGKVRWRVASAEKLSHKGGRRRYDSELTKIRQSLPDAWGRANRRLPRASCAQTNSDLSSEVGCRVECAVLVRPWNAAGGFEANGGRVAFGVIECAGRMPCRCYAGAHIRGVLRLRSG
jgi:hypothetical protein